MNNAFLAACCALAAAAGSLLLVFSHFPAESVQLSSLSADYAGKNVLVSGSVRYANVTDRRSVLVLCQGSACVRVLVFERLVVAGGSRAVVEGRVNDDAEIVATRQGVDVS